MTTHSAVGSIMQLYAVDKSNFFFNRRKNLYSEEYSCIKFNNNKLTIKKVGDKCVPLYIKSDKEIKNIELIIGRIVINKIPLEFCNKLYGHEIKKDNYFLYKIPWNLMFETDLFLSKLDNYNFDIIIESDNICDAELYLKSTYLDFKPRRNLIDNDFAYFIKIFQWKNITIKKGLSWNKINFTGITKGLFIENIDISKIKSLGMQFNGQTRFNYNKTMIDLFVQKIGKDIIYIQLDDKNNKFDDFIFTSSPNFSRIDYIDIKFDTEIDQNIRILNLSANCLQYIENKVKLKYEHNIIKIIPKFIKKLIEEDKICLIDHETIGNGEHYMNCITCKKNFKEDNLKKWFEKSATCPHCRSKWQDDTVYINEITV